MNPVGAADHDGMFVFGGPAFEHGMEFGQVVQNDPARLLHHRAERRIHDDRRDEAHLRDIDWSAP